MSAMFDNPYASPPGGKFFYETHGERVEGRCMQEVAPKVRALMRKYSIPGTAELVLAEYMCPRLGPAASWFCRGRFDRSDDVRPLEAYENSRPYFRKPLVPFDVTERRLERCMHCAKHLRGWCMTCTGHYSRMMAGFGGGRAELPIDRGTGVCTCARAYEAAIASVEYAAGERVWKGVPDTCWRKTDV